MCWLQLITVKSFNGTYNVITKGSGNVSNEVHVYNPISENIHFVGFYTNISHSVINSFSDW